MRHRLKGRKLKRTYTHREAMMSNLSASLIKHHRVHTTLAKAKELRLYVEPLVTKARKALADSGNKEAGVHYRRLAKSFLRDDEAVKALFEVVAPKAADRQGGYTRVLKTGFRQGDGGETAIIEFVDFNYVEKKEKEQAAAEETAGKKGKKEDSGKKEKKDSAKKEVKAETKTKKAPKKKEETEEKPKRTRKKKTEA